MGVCVSKRVLKVLVAVLVVFSMGCKRSQVLPIGDGEVRFTSTFSEGTPTRLTGDAWDGGDAIGVFMKQGTGLSDILSANKRYTTLGTGNFSATGTDVINYPESGSVDFIAYYPYQEGLSGTVLSIDVADQSDQGAIDVLYSDNATGLNGSSETAHLEFSRRLTKVEFTVHTGAGIVDLEGLNVTFRNVNSTAEFDLETGVVGNAGIPQDIEAKVTTLGAARVVEVVLVPDDFSSTEVLFELPGKSFLWTLPAGTNFEQGKRNIYNVVLQGDGSVGEKVFRAGVSTVNVTGTVEPGYTVHDSLFARTLVLDDGDRQLVFIVADLLGLPRTLCDEAKHLIAQESNIPPENVMIAITHTHSATPTYHRGLTTNGFSRRFTYVDDLPLEPHQVAFAQQLANGVKNAVANLEPAKIGWGTADGSEWVFNRRWIMKNQIVGPHGRLEDVVYNPGTHNSNRDRPAGPVDPEIPFIAVQSVDGRPISILANYSTHYAGGVTTGHVSADYYGVFATRIRELVGADGGGDPFAGMIAYGTGADVNTINYNYGETPPNYADYVKMQLVGEYAAGQVYDVYQTIQYHDWVPLGTAQSEFSVQVRRADAELLDYAAGIRDGSITNPHSRAGIQANYILQNQAEWPNNFSFYLQVFKVGDLAVCAVPFEVFAEMGLEIKAQTPFETTFTMSLSNGGYGYLPTPPQHALGGYETWVGHPSKAQIDASDLITQKLVQMLDGLKN